MPRAILAAALLALGCAQPSPHVRPLSATAIAINTVGSLPSAASDPSRTAPYTRVARALRRYRAALESKDGATGVVTPRELRRELFDEIGEPALVSVVEARCSNEMERCWRTSHRVTHPVSFAVLLLREFGALPLLRMMTRFESLGIRPPVVREHVYRRLMNESVDNLACNPPCPGEVAQARKDLADFVVVDEISASPVPRELTEAERDDLAYFMVAVSAAGPPRQRRASARRAFPRCSASSSKHLMEEVRLRDQALREAEVRGELEQLVRARQEYLHALGYPGQIHSCWGPARPPASRYEQVKSCLAGDLEALGRTREAEQLYRHIRWWRPYCGAGSRRNQDSLTRGLIRAAERSGRCRSVVAERLRALDGEPYGPQRLADAGFDLPRLYRGALLTRNRDGEADRLIQSLNAARPDLAARAIARMQRLGPEAWERKVLALEGLADSAQRDALEPLETVLPVLNEEAKLRALRVLGILAWRTRAETVACTQVWGYSIHRATRPIHSLGHSCETRLSEAEARAVSREIAPLLGDPSEDVRVAAAETLGSIASKWSRRALQRVSRKRTPSRAVICSGSSCNTDEDLHSAATEALAKIDRAYRRGEEEPAEEEAIEE